jgi:hypothetical protein
VQVVCAHCQSLDTLTSLAAVHSSVTSAAASAAPALKAALEDRWAAWLAAVERPVSGQDFAPLDSCLGAFMLGDDQEWDDSAAAELEDLTRVQRLWVHRRCQQLGLHSATFDFSAGDVACMRVSKPEGWQLDWQRGRDISFPPAPQPQPQPQRGKSKRKKTAMESWSAVCQGGCVRCKGRCRDFTGGLVCMDRHASLIRLHPPPPPARPVAPSPRRRCEATLDAYCALYDEDGDGPFCPDCIEENPELEGLDWTYKCDSWRGGRGRRDFW